MFGALKRGFRSMASLKLILVRNVVGELRPKRTLAASRGVLAAVRLSCYIYICCFTISHNIHVVSVLWTFPSSSPSACCFSCISVLLSEIKCMCMYVNRVIDDLSQILLP